MEDSRLNSFLENYELVRKANENLISYYCQLYVMRKVC